MSAKISLKDVSAADGYKLYDVYLLHDGSICCK